MVLVSLAVGVADWVAVATRRKRAEYVLKPATLAVLIVAAIALRGEEPAARWGFAVAALVLSLCGDVFLMLPRDLFLAGLVAFLLAHLAYVAALNPSVPPLLPTLPAAILATAMGGALFLRIRGQMIRTSRGGLVVPVGVYVVVITAMVVSAAGTAGRAEWAAGSSAFTMAGALLFYGSDAMIGWTRFVSDFPRSRVLITAAYHLGQVGLVVGLLG